ncbi:GH14371 [Drosophila grimshawi]|uniref:GH14371 n=2 Tax=Drosophila grimshawi TaxID=7222 RepID=B4J1U0_DROGR|nr:GH14371 [Drosophila grimshawi]
MSSRNHSRFIFEMMENMRIFRHQRFGVECPTCLSRVRADEPYRHHWLDDKADQHIKLGLTEKLLLKRIEREHIETFFLCDESAVGRTNEFLLEAGMEAVPQLLRFLSYEATRLEITVGFYVEATKQLMYYESIPVVINHYLDIKDTVDMVFSVLLEKISNYVLMKQRVPLEACTIKRIKLLVKRQWNEKLELPLQYRLKNDTKFLNANDASAVDLALLTDSYMSNGLFTDSLKVNLYCLRVCASTKELYAVPYLLRSEDVANTPTFLILSDVEGEFRGMHEIRNLRRFLRADSQDHSFECRKCKMHFSDRLQYTLHKQINCGSGFMVWHIDRDSTEFYENCLLLPRQFFKFAWFGIGNE